MTEHKEFKKYLEEYKDEIFDDFNNYTDLMKEFEDK
jgi:uncharacterized membrane-anchored protein YhcB (DUF1043 family)